MLKLVFLTDKLQPYNLASSKKLLL